MVRRVSPRGFTRYIRGVDHHVSFLGVQCQCQWLARRLPEVGLLSRHADVVAPPHQIRVPWAGVGKPRHIVRVDRWSISYRTTDNLNITAYVAP